MSVWPLSDDFADGHDGYCPDVDEVMCPRCHGSGREWEGWECELCDGDGYLEV